MKRRHEGNAENITSILRGADDLAFLQEAEHKNPGVVSDTRNMSTGATVIYLAVSWGKLDVLNWYIRQGYPLHRRTRQGETLLHAAAKNGHVEVLRRLLEVMPQSFGCITSEGYTMLQLALFRNERGVVQCIANEWPSLKARFPNLRLHAGRLRAQASTVPSLTQTPLSSHSAQSFSSPSSRFPPPPALYALSWHSSSPHSSYPSRSSHSSHSSCVPSSRQLYYASFASETELAILQGCFSIVPRLLEERPQSLVHLMPHIVTAFRQRNVISEELVAFLQPYKNTLLLSHELVIHLLADDAYADIVVDQCRMDINFSNHLLKNWLLYVDVSPATAKKLVQENLISPSALYRFWHDIKLSHITNLRPQGSCSSRTQTLDALLPRNMLLPLPLRDALQDIGLQPLKFLDAVYLLVRTVIGGDLAQLQQILEDHAALGDLHDQESCFLQCHRKTARISLQMAICRKQRDQAILLLDHRCYMHFLFEPFELDQKNQNQNHHQQSLRELQFVLEALPERVMDLCACGWDILSDVYNRWVLAREPPQPPERREAVDLDLEQMFRRLVDEPRYETWRTSVVCDALDREDALALEILNNRQQPLTSFASGDVLKGRTFTHTVLALLVERQFDDLLLLCVRDSAIPDLLYALICIAADDGLIARVLEWQVGGAAVGVNRVVNEDVGVSADVNEDVNEDADVDVKEDVKEEVDENGDEGEVVDLDDKSIRELVRRERWSTLQLVENLARKQGRGRRLRLLRLFSMPDAEKFEGDIEDKQVREVIAREIRIVLEIAFQTPSSNISKRLAFEVGFSGSQDLVAFCALLHVRLPRPQSKSVLVSLVSGIAANLTNANALLNVLLQSVSVAKAPLASDTFQTIMNVLWYSSDFRPDLCAAVMDRSNTEDWQHFYPLRKIGCLGFGTCRCSTRWLAWQQLCMARGFDALQAHWYIILVLATRTAPCVSTIVNVLLGHCAKYMANQSIPDPSIIDRILQYRWTSVFCDLLVHLNMTWSNQTHLDLRYAPILVGLLQRCLLPMPDTVVLVIGEFLCLEWW